MLKRTLIFLFFIAIILSLGGCKKDNKLPDDSGKIIFYYSTECPHCQNVEKYVSDNNIRSIVQFEEKEVSGNEDNALQFYDKVQKCNIKPEEAGVPLLWDGSTCISGDQDIISFFFRKMKEVENMNGN